MAIFFGKQRKPILTVFLKLAFANLFSFTSFVFKQVGSIPSQNFIPFGKKERNKMEVINERIGVKLGFEKAYENQDDDDFAFYRISAVSTTTDRLRTICADRKSRKRKLTIRLERNQG